MLVDASRDRIRTLRAVGRSDDHFALRLALERTLDRVSLRPPDLPASAIVCVRRMRIDHGSNAAQWTAAIGERMTALMRSTVRPFGGPVPANAEVVLFMDEAELLACLARDWQRGDGGAWWWRACFGEGLNGSIVQRAFLASAIYVPGAIERLARAHCVSSVVRAMPDTFCEELGAAVASSFAVSGWTMPTPPRGRDRDVTTPSSGDVGVEPRVVPRVASVLRDYSSADTHTLSPAQRALTVLALLLERAPAVARAEGVVAVLRRVEHCDVSTEAAPAREDVRARDRERPVPPRPVGLHRTEITERSERARREEPEIASGSRQPDTLTSRQPPVQAGDVATPLNRDSDARESAGANLSPALTAGERVVQDHARGEAIPPVRVVESQFAGIFYLINLALHLELYADFTAPLRAGLALPIGDFLALVGEHIFDDAFRLDPVWDLLAELGGREHLEPAGLEFDALQELTLSMKISDWTSILAACAAPALDLDEPAAALPFLCARPGRLALTSTRLDATFELTAHPLSIRVAGLDRDPGWVPAAGRVIRFHYE